MNISVIISVWKRPVQLELILSELDSQAKDNSLHLEVIVSDSHSGKEIDDVVADNIHKKKNINIIHQHTKNILSAKRNFGASLAHGDYLIFLDDDCIPASGYISSLLNYLKKMNSKSVLCGEVRFENELIETSNYYRYRNSLHPKFSDSHDISMNAWTFVAMNCVLDRKAFSSGIVSYNENFIGYGCEDHEFGWQLEKNDFKIIFADFKILHHEYSGDIEGYTKKIRATARDGMNVLSKVRPEMFS
ncbi:TPA: glycosyltransferase family 2 protein, partial [Escherichia coli]|nr:glycosyltransferase family 2 protein [Escherichia coli]HDV3231955.1 glycosyltransferase family 2 protein [Escherichia coli]